MRGAFFEALLKLAERDERVFLVVGDLGFGVTEAFARRFPGQFLNAGVAEQNMTGIAAGLWGLLFLVTSQVAATVPVLAGLAFAAAHARRRRL